MVGTGPWIFGRHVLLPAGTVVRVDRGDRKVFVDRTEDEIRNSPEYDIDKQDPTDGVYRDAHVSYYGPYYGGPI